MGNLAIHPLDLMSQLTQSESPGGEFGSIRLRPVEASVAVPRRRCEFELPSSNGNSEQLRYRSEATKQVGKQQHCY